MNKDNNKESFKDKLLSWIDVFSESAIVKAMVAGMTAPMSAIIIGSFVALLLNPPIPATTTNGILLAIKGWCGANASWLNLLNQVTTNAIGLYAVVGVTIAYAKQKKVNPTNYVILALVIFLTTCSDVVKGETGNGLLMTYFGSLGLFSAIIIGILTVELGLLLKKKGVKITLPASVPPAVSEPIENLFVNVILVVFAIIVRLVIYSTTGTYLPTAINRLFSPLLASGDTLIAVIIYIFIIRFLWFFGIHGGNVANSVLAPVLATYAAENLAAYAAGEALPHIFTNAFWGGCANLSTLPLVLGLFLWCRSAQCKAIAKVGVVPAIFGIGEPVTFGLPLVLNLDLLLPNLIGNVGTGVIFYVTMKLGWCAKPAMAAITTLPGPVRAFFVTLDWRSIIVWTVAFVFSTIVYYPLSEKIIPRYCGQYLGILK